MKKAVLCLIMLAGITSVAQAQSTRFGVKAGVNLAKVSSDNNEGTKNLVGLAAGLMADFGFSDLLSFHPELLYSQKGTKLDSPRATGTVRTSYLDLPLLLRVNADGLFFEAGPQVGLVVAQKSEVAYGGGSPITNTSTNGVQKIDLGYIAGIGYQLASGLELDIRYNGGISGVNNSSLSRNSVFQFQLGYLFGGK